MNQHNEAILAFQQGRVAEALCLLEELLAAKETAELWNDWAAVQMGAGDLGKAETGFARALELDPEKYRCNRQPRPVAAGKGRFGSSTAAADASFAGPARGTAKTCGSIIDGSCSEQAFG